MKKIVKIALILLVTYFIAWTVSYMFIYGADNIFIDHMYKIDWSNFFSDFIDVWMGNAFTRAAAVQWGAILIFIILCIIYVPYSLLKTRYGKTK